MSVICCAVLCCDALCLAMLCFPVPPKLARPASPTLPSPGHHRRHSPASAAAAGPGPFPAPLSLCSAVGGFTGSVMIPQGSETVVASALRSASPLAWNPGGASAVIRCDDFRIDYREDGSVRQFYSDLTGGLCCLGMNLAGLGWCQGMCKAQGGSARKWLTAKQAAGWGCGAGWPRGTRISGPPPGAMPRC
jgi:hypothetical protein